MAQSSVGFNIDTPETLAAQWSQSKTSIIETRAFGRVDINFDEGTFELVTNKEGGVSNKQGGVTVMFGENAMKTLNVLIRDTISLVVKTALLKGLHDLNDEKISKKIRANHIDTENPGRNSLDIVNVTLRQIQNLPGSDFFPSNPPHCNAPSHPL